MRNRLTTLLAVCLVIALAVVSRAVYIQVIRDARIEKLAKHQFKSKFLVRPRRGAILDRNGEALAINAEIQSLAANPSKIKNAKTLARLLSKATGIPYSRLSSRLQGKREFVWIKRHLSEDELNRLKKLGVIDPDGDLPQGLWIVKESKRVYPHGELAAHVLGDVNLDSEGLEGVELWANRDLQGKVVSVSAIKDALGRPTFIDAVAAQHIKDGEPVSLTLDAALQFSVEQELRNAVQKTGARSGTVIVMNASNGEILAMANEPTFNPNKKGNPASVRRNRALTDGYEPGSTMKAVLLAAALQKGMKLSDQLWGERGSMVLQGRRISEAEAHEKFEWISLKKMIQVSSNIGAAKLALKLGPDYYHDKLRTYGFGNRTGTGFPGEISGRLLPRKAWKPLTLANIGFGQGLLVTPMQMTRIYASFLNGGWLVQPKLVRSQIKGFAPEPPKRIFNGKVAEQVVEALKTVTQQEGTGIKAALEGYVVAGKTGTAQVVDPSTGRYSRSRYIPSFIGFAVGVEPKLVIFTALDEPKGVYYASETSAPLFRAVLNAAATRFSLPAASDPRRTLAKSQPTPKPDRGKVILSDRITTSLAKVLPAQGPQVEELPRLEWHRADPEGGLTWTMPSLKGLTAREVVRVLKGRDFKLQVLGEGVVKTQVPEEGKKLAEGGLIRIQLSE